jgi:acetyltransferase-like isoleucine patch superfamily enzyme
LLFPLFVFIAYCITVLIFGIVHSQIVLRFTLGIGIKPGKYPHHTGEGRLVGVKLTADSIFKSMIKVFTFIPFIWGIFLFPYGMRLYGLKTGKNVHIATNTYIESAGLVEIEEGTFVGYGATIVAHLHENREIIISPIKIGKKVTIGGFAAIAPGVSIGDKSIIGGYSVVTKGVTIPANEIWMGIPARPFKKKNNDE